MEDLNSIFPGAILREVSSLCSLLAVSSLCKVGFCHPLADLALDYCPHAFPEFSNGISIEPNFCWIVFKSLIKNFLETTADARFNFVNRRSKHVSGSGAKFFHILLLHFPEKVSLVLHNKNVDCVKLSRFMFVGCQFFVSSRNIFKFLPIQLEDWSGSETK